MKKRPWNDLNSEQKNLFWDKASAINLSKLQQCDANDIANITSILIDTITDIARAIYKGVPGEQLEIRTGIKAFDGKRDREVWKVIYRDDGTYAVFFKGTKAGKEPGHLDSTDRRLIIYKDKQP